MDLRQIEYVEAVARHASFTRAAADLHVAQPALSSAIRRLESELGVRLFDRTSRSVTLTAAGETFLSRARRILEEVGQLGADMSEYSGSSRGVIRVCWWYHVDPEVVDYLAEYRAAYPLVEVSVVEKPTREALEALRSGEIDITSIVVTEGLDLAGIEWVELGGEPFVLAVAPNHPLAGRDSVQIDDLLLEPFIVTRPGTILRQCFDEAFSGRERPPQVVVETNEFAATMALVAAGLGVAIVTQTIATQAGTPPSSLVPVAGARSLVLAAAWSAGPKTLIVQRAIEVAKRRAARLTATRAEHLSPDEASLRGA